MTVFMYQDMLEAFWILCHFGRQINTVSGKAGRRQILYRIDGQMLPVYFPPCQRLSVGPQVFFPLYLIEKHITAGRQHSQKPQE